MSRTSLLIAFALCCSLQGCTFYKSGAKLTAAPTAELSKAYGDARRMGFPAHTRLAAELERRSTFTPKQWEDIKAGRIGVGDSMELVAAAWGSPTTTTTHTEVGNSGVRWCYEGSTFQPSGTVVFRGGRVSSITQ